MSSTDVSASTMAIPDQDIFPHATGAAAKTVEAHQDPQDVVFYSGWFCPFVQRTWIALEEKGIPYQYKETNPYKKEPEYLAINPKGLVPSIVYKGGPGLYESNILNEFLEEVYPDNPLLPSDPTQRALARIWIDFIGKSIVPPKFVLQQAQTKEGQDKARQEFIDALKKYEAQIKGPYFFGEQFTLVDVTLAPWLVRDWIVIEHRGYKREDVGEKFAEYAKRVESRDSVLKTSSELEHYIPLVMRYLKDEAQSEAAKAIRAGRAIP